MSSSSNSSSSDSSSSRSSSSNSSSSKSSSSSQSSSSSAGDYGSVSIEATRRVSQVGDEFRLQVWVTSTSLNIPGEVFLFRLAPYYPDNDPAPFYIFVRACTYADMINYPAEDSTYSTVFYRRRMLDQSFKSINQLNTDWEVINTALQALIEDIVETNSVAPTTTVYTY